MTRRYAIILLTVLLSILTAGAVNVSPRVFRNYTAANGLADNGAQTILCTKTGRLVITTAGQINFYDGASFSYIDPLDENIYALSDYRGNYHLYFDKYHHIWLKNTGSVTCVELITERFVPSIEDVFAEFGVKERVMDLFVDRTGVVWLLTANGLYSVATKQYIKPRAGLNLQDLEVYKDKFLMLFYENGLMEMYDIAKGKRLAENRPYNDDMARHYAASSLVMMDSTKVYQIRNGAKDAILMQYDVPRKEWTELLAAVCALRIRLLDSTREQLRDYPYRGTEYYVRAAARNRYQRDCLRPPGWYVGRYRESRHSLLDALQTAIPCLCLGHPDS